MKQLWEKCNAKDAYPFGRRYFDTMIFELMLDYAKGTMAEGYSLNNLIKKYGVSNTKAHTAASDTLAAKEVFDKQIAYLRKLLNN
jgi:DNA polymerase III epsilon subunit-like protein